MVYQPPWSGWVYHKEWKRYGRTWFRSKVIWMENSFTYIFWRYRISLRLSMTSHYCKPYRISRFLIFVLIWVLQKAFSYTFMLLRGSLPYIQGIVLEFRFLTTELRKNRFNYDRKLLCVLIDILHGKLSIKFSRDLWWLDQKLSHLTSTWSSAQATEADLLLIWWSDKKNNIR